VCVAAALVHKHTGCVQAKYAAVARGDAAIYLRLPTRADYVEAIWDHAAGALLVQCANGRVRECVV
jgi:3'(2'), 5'-bisphosphate nucleotidase